MTLQGMIELIQQHHSTMGETEIILGLNRAKDDFCSKTGLIRDTFTQSSGGGQRYYTLDPKINKIIKVQVNDVEIPRLIGNPIVDDDEFDGEAGLTASGTTSKDRYWFVDNDRLGIVEKGSVSRDGVVSAYQSISVAGVELRIHCLAKEADFGTDLSAESRLPSQYHNALVYKVIGEGYLTAGNAEFNPQLSQLFDGKYDGLVKDGKRDSKSNYMSSFGVIRPQAF